MDSPVSNPLRRNPLGAYHVLSSRSSEQLRDETRIISPASLRAHEVLLLVGLRRFSQLSSQVLLTLPKNVTLSFSRNFQRCLCQQLLGITPHENVATCWIPERFRNLCRIVPHDDATEFLDSNGSRLCNHRCHGNQHPRGGEDNEMWSNQQSGLLINGNHHF